MDPCGGDADHRTLADSMLPVVTNAQASCENAPKEKERYVRTVMKFRTILLLSRPIQWKGIFKMKSGKRALAFKEQKNQTKIK
jgi:hypothetical protein